MTAKARFRAPRRPDVELAPVVGAQGQAEIRRRRFSVAQISNLARDQELPRAIRSLRRRHPHVGDRQTAKINRDAGKGIDARRRRRDRRRAHDHQADEDKSWAGWATGSPTPPRRGANRFGKALTAIWAKPGTHNLVAWLTVPMEWPMVVFGWKPG